MINETLNLTSNFISFSNFTYNPVLLIVKGNALIEGTLEVSWIKSWNIGIITLIICLLIIWNIWLTYKLMKVKQ